MNEHRVTLEDIARIMGGEGGIDLESIMEGGKTVAMRIVGLTPGTTADRLGARNGDTIESLNEVPLSGVAAAYAAADRAIKSGRVVISGKREGAPYTTVLVLDSGH
jgi:hypothetical protein